MSPTPEQQAREQIVIRDETKADIAVIDEVTAAAFATLEISNHTEPVVSQR